MTWGGVGWRQGKGDGQVGVNEGGSKREGAQPLAREGGKEGGRGGGGWRLGRMRVETMGGKGRDGYDDTWKGR